MLRHSRSVLCVAVLVVWVIAGPLAMLLSGCAAMGDGCAVPCTAAPGLVPPGGDVARLDAWSAALPWVLTPAALLLSSAPEPPPKPVLIS